MERPYKVLNSDTDFLAAALYQARVYVVSTRSDQIIEIFDYGGQVEKYTPESIKINGTHFFRNQFEFRIDLKD